MCRTLVPSGDVAVTSAKRGIGECASKLSMFVFTQPKLLSFTRFMSWGSGTSAKRLARKRKRGREGGAVNEEIGYFGIYEECL